MQNSEKNWNANSSWHHASITTLLEYLLSSVMLKILNLLGGSKCKVYKMALPWCTNYKVKCISRVIVVHFIMKFFFDEHLEWTAIALLSYSAHRGKERNMSSEQFIIDYPTFAAKYCLNFYNFDGSTASMHTTGGWDEYRAKAQLTWKQNIIY